MRDRINDASFRQNLDPISKNILRRQNPLELVFEDISTFDAENPIVGKLLREIDIKKKQLDSDFIKSLPGEPGKEFEIKKHLDKLRGTKTSFFNDRNNNNNNNDNPDLFGGPGGLPLTLPSLEDFVDGGGPPQPPPADAPLNLNSPSLFESNRPPLAPRSNFFEPFPYNAPSYIGFDNNGQIGNDLFSSQAAVREGKTKTQQEVDGFLCELPEDIPELELGDGLLQTLGTEAEDLLHLNAPPTKKEEEDKILKNLMGEYNVEDIRDTMDET